MSAATATTARRVPGCGVHNTADHQRRRLEPVLRLRPEVVGLESPRNLEVIEVTAVDLVERRVACVGEIRSVARPLPIGRRLLPMDRHEGEQTRDGYPPHRHMCSPRTMASYGTGRLYG